MSQAHIIGVTVNETTPDIRITTVTVTANSRNRRPMIPSISRIGINTAMSETVMEMMVKPHFAGAVDGRLPGRLTLFDVTHHILDDDNRIVDHESHRNGHAHQGDVVQTVVERVHHTEGAHQGQRGWPHWE